MAERCWRTKACDREHAFMFLPSFFCQLLCLREACPSDREEVVANAQVGRKNSFLVNKQCYPIKARCVAAQLGSDVTFASHAWNNSSIVMTESPLWCGGRDFGLCIIRRSAMVAAKEMQWMNKCYLIDMDGVLYRGKQLIPGSDYFIQQLRAKNIPFRLLTNNSQRHAPRVGMKLGRLGIDVEEEHVFTAMATARFLANQKPRRHSVSSSAKADCSRRMHQNGYAVVDTDPDYVVVGEGRTFNLEQVDAAVRMIVTGPS